jgi:branched-chain amino acid transport system ATP-binding protein
VLELVGVVKRFGQLVVINDVSMSLKKGIIGALIGPNGAGKTSLFNLISGFIRPDAGDITLNGASIVRLAPEQICAAGVGRTFQIAQPFAGLTVRENIAVGAHLHRANRADALRHAQQVAEEVGLAAQADKPAFTLTVAGRKRLELAKALATDPSLLLLDEVMAGLTPVEIDEIIPVIRRIRDRGVTILLIEHVMRAVMNLSDHAWVLNSGKLIAEGAPRFVASDPAVIEAYLGHGASERMKREGQGAAHA